jgi:hypothetical protein
VPITGASIFDSRWRKFIHCGYRQMSSKRPEKQETQIERFKRAARELGADENKQEFEEKLRRIAQLRPKRAGKGTGDKEP